MDNVRKILHPPIFEDVEKTRIAALANLILLALILFDFIALISVGLFAQNTPPAQVISSVVFIILCVGLKIALHRGYVTVVNFFIVGILLILVSVILITGGSIRAPAISIFILTSVIAGLLIGRNAAIWTAVVSTVVVTGIVYGEINDLLPEPYLDVSFQQVVIFAVSAVMTVILLNQALHRIQDSLDLALKNEAETRSLAASLEQRVAERTASMEQTNLYLALATEIGQNVAQVRDLDVMLRDAAEIIRAFFGMYYVQVYLVNPAQTELVLHFGTGEVGAELLARRHRLPLDDSSINGRAAITKRSVVIADTAASPAFRPNPLLPNTRSEMAVPLLVGDQLVGVLNMQSDQPSALSESSLVAFEPLSGQIAIAIQNTRLFAETQQARSELEALARRLTRAGWDEYLDAVHKPEFAGFVYDQDQVTPLAEALPVAPNALAAEITIGGERLGALVVEGEETSQRSRAAELINSVARQMAQQIENLRLLESADRYRGEAEQAMRRLTRQGWQAAQAGVAAHGYIYREHQVQPLDETPQTENLRTLPLVVRDEPIGEIAIPGGELAPEDESLLESIRQQLAAHLENLRLSQETQTALTQTEALYAASARVVQSTNIGQVLRAVVENTPLRQFERASIMLFNRPWGEAMPETGTLAAEWERSGQQPSVPLGAIFPLVGVPTTRQARRDRPTFVHVTPDMPGLTAEEYELVKQIGIHSVILPIVAGDQWIGWLSVASNDDVDLSEDDLRQIATLTGQAATVIQSIRLLDEATARARREQALRQIATRVRTFVEPEMILRTAARELGDALGRKVTVQLGHPAQFETAENSQESNHE
jgi:GAF domain-containing protein